MAAMKSAISRLTSWRSTSGRIVYSMRTYFVFVLMGSSTMGSGRCARVPAECRVARVRRAQADARANQPGRIGRFLQVAASGRHTAAIAEYLRLTSVVGHHLDHHGVLECHE